MSTRSIAVRLGQALLVLWAAYTLAFILLTALPSDAIIARYGSPDLGLNPQQIDEIRQEYGADKPIIIQYFIMLGGFLVGNFGYSVQTGTSVASVLAEALPSTLSLAVLAFVLACILAFSIGILATISNPLRAFFQGLPALLVSMPSFWLGIILIQLVSFRFNWVPVIGATPLQSLILPAFTLSVPIGAPLAQVLIRSIDEVQHQPFITVVRSRGASEYWIFFKNVLKNAMLPTLTMAGLLFGELVGGAVVTEAVFGRAGIGRLTVDAVANRDTPVLMAIVVLAALVYIIINLAVDLLYPVIDPRTRRKA